MTLYTKNAKNEYVPVEISKVVTKDMDDHLIIVRVGTDELPASTRDVDLTEDSFADASVLDDIGNISIIVTPYQLSIEPLSNSELANKSLCVQIESGEDMSGLEEFIKGLYRKLKSKLFDVTVLPTPLTIKEYVKVKSTLRRCSLKKKRRAGNIV